MGLLGVKSTLLKYNGAVLIVAFLSNPSKEKLLRSYLQLRRFVGEFPIMDETKSKEAPKDGFPIVKSHISQVFKGWINNFLPDVVKERDDGNSININAGLFRDIYVHSFELDQSNTLEIIYF